MLRSALGVIVGYIVMFILQIATFMTIYSLMGPNWSFRPASYDASTRWTVMQFGVILVTTIIAGLICAPIARGGKAPLLLAAVCLLLGRSLAFASPALTTTATLAPLPSDVSTT